MDIFSRKIVGWSTNTEVNSGLVCKSLSNAIEQRGVTDYLLFHSDRGSQYSSDESQKFKLSHGIESSMRP